VSYNSAYASSTQITASDGRKFGAPTIFSEVSGSSGCGSTCWYTTPTCASGWTATKPSSGYYISATSRSYANNGARTCYRTSDIKCSTYGYTYSSPLDSSYFVCSATTISGTNGLVCYTCSHARCAISPASSINTTYFTTASASDNQGSLGTRYRCTGRTTNTEANQPNGTYFNYGTASCAYQGGNANPCATMYGYRCSGRTSGTESAAPNSTFFKGITSSSCSGVGTGWRCTGRNASDASACSTTYFTGQHSSTCSGITGYRGTGRTTGTYASAPNGTFFNYGSAYCSGVGNGYRCTSRNASDASQASSTYFTGQHSSSCTGITGYRCTGRASGTCSSQPNSTYFSYNSAYCSGVGYSYRTTGCKTSVDTACIKNYSSTSSGCGHTCLYGGVAKTCEDLGYLTNKPSSCYNSHSVSVCGKTCWINDGIIYTYTTQTESRSCGCRGTQTRSRSNRVNTCTNGIVSYGTWSDYGPCNNQSDYYVKSESSSRSCGCSGTQSKSRDYYCLTGWHDWSGYGSCNNQSDYYVKSESSSRDCGCGGTQSKSRNYYCLTGWHAWSDYNSCSKASCSGGKVCVNGSCVGITINVGAVVTQGGRNNCGSYNKVGFKLQCGSTNWSGSVTVSYSCYAYTPTCSNGSQTGVSSSRPSGSKTITCYGSSQPVAETAISSDYQYLTCTDFKVTGYPSGATVNGPSDFEAGYYYVRPTSCAEGGYVSSCPGKQTGTKVDYGGLTCYKDCKCANTPSSCPTPTCTGGSYSDTNTFGTPTGGMSISQQAGTFLKNCQDDCGIGSCVGNCTFNSSYPGQGMRCRCCGRQ